MYQIARTPSVNNLGTAVLLEALSERAGRSTARRRVEHEHLRRGPVPDHARRVAAGASARRAAAVARLGGARRRRRAAVALPTPETKQPSLASVYALSKYDQERMCLMVGQAYGIPTVALRFFNVFGTRQALSNPYTGVLAIFASRCSTTGRR
jgi:dTDP-L-rhamnose 4-epimerase